MNYYLIIYLVGVLINIIAYAVHRHDLTASKMFPDLPAAVFLTCFITIVSSWGFASVVIYDTVGHLFRSLKSKQ